MKYKRYRFFHNKIFITWSGLWLSITFFTLYCIWGMGSTYILAALIAFGIIFMTLYFLWGCYVDQKNRNTETDIVYPIIDKQLRVNAKKYPSVYTVIKNSYKSIKLKSYTFLKNLLMTILD